MLEDLIRKELSTAPLNLPTIADEQEAATDLLVAIHNRVKELMAEDSGLLFSYLYRLDVKEELVEQAMNGLIDADSSLALAKIILSRQLERVKTKKSYRQDPIDGWEW